MLLNRIAELTVGESKGKAVIIRDLRFTFTIKKDNDKSPNQLTLELYNMNKETRRIVERVNNSVILKAGYEKDAGVIAIFTGTVLSSKTVKQGNDIITKLLVCDGILPLRDSKVSLSYVPNTSAITILQDIANAFGLPVQPLPKQVIDRVYPNGFVFCGKTEAAMSHVCNYLGLTWSIQNHEIQILTKSYPLNDQLIVLTPDSGLIGIPTRIVDATRNQSQGDSSKVVLLAESPANTPGENFYQIDGYNVECLLQPRIYPGSYVGLESDALLLDPSVKKQGQKRPRAFFRAEVVTHHGDTHHVNTQRSDTHQGKWITKCELKAVEGQDGGK